MCVCVLSTVWAKSNHYVRIKPLDFCAQHICTVPTSANFQLYLVRKSSRRFHWITPQTTLTTPTWIRSTSTWTTDRPRSSSRCTRSIQSTRSWAMRAVFDRTMVKYRGVDGFWSHAIQFIPADYHFICKICAHAHAHMNAHIFKTPMCVAHIPWRMDGRAQRIPINTIFCVCMTWRNLMKNALNRACARAHLQKHFCMRLMRFRVFV